MNSLIPSPTRSDIQIDGVDAYAPGSLLPINLSAAGFPVLNYSYTVDPNTGDLEITEQNPIVKCFPDTSYPPDNTKCTSFVSTGVRVDRTITSTNDGHLVTITDDWVSTDASSHTLDLLPNNSQRFGPQAFGAGNGPNIAYRFPGESSFSTHAQGDSVSFPDSGPGEIAIQAQGAADGQQNTGQGAIVFDRPASPANFIKVTAGSSSNFQFHQTGTVPMSGQTTFRFAYAQGYTCSSVEALAQAALTSFGGGTAIACPSTTPPPSTSTPVPKKKKCKKKRKSKERSAAAAKKCKKKRKKK